MISDLVTRIESRTSSFVSVKACYSANPIKEHIDETPTVLVLPGPDKGSDSRSLNRMVQDLELTVDVYIVCKVVDLHDLKAELRGAILGYQTSDITNFRFHQGQPFEFTGEWVTWREIYAAESQISESP